MNRHGGGPEILLWKNKIWESRVSNTGDLAIIQNTILKLHRLLPATRIHLFSDDPTYTANLYGCEAHPIARIFDPVYLHRLMRRINLVVLGGGTIIQDNYFAGVIPINLWMGLLARIYGKTVVCNAIGVGAASEISRLGGAFARFALRRFQAITVRDDESKRVLDRWLSGAVPVTRTNDIAVDLPPAEWSRVRTKLAAENVDLESHGFVVVAARKIYHHELSRLHFLPSSLRVRLGLMPQAYKTGIESFRQNLAALIDHIVREHGMRVLLMPFYSTGHSTTAEGGGGTRRYFASGDDRFISEILTRVEERSAVVALRGDYSPDELLAVIARCQALVGVPYHSVVFATSQNVPALGIGYVSKVERYLHLLGLQEHVVSASLTNQPTLESMRSAFDRLWDQRAKISSHLAARNRELFELSEQNVLLIRDLVERRGD